MPAEQLTKLRAMFGLKTGSAPPPPPTPNISLLTVSRQKFSSGFLLPVFGYRVSVTFLSRSIFVEAMPVLFDPVQPARGVSRNIEILE